MSYRKSSLRPQRSGRFAPAAARIWQHHALTSVVETLEERALLSAVLPGFDDHGIAIRNAQATGLAAIAITATSNSQLSNRAMGSGLFIDLNNANGSLNSLKNISITDVTIANNGNAGAQIRLANLALDSLIIDRAKITGNGGAGLVIDLTNTSIKQLTIWDSTNNFAPAAVGNANSGASRFSNNAFDGICVTVANVAINNLRVSGNVVQNNVGNGVLYNFNLANVATFAMEDNEISGNTRNGSVPSTTQSGSGVHFQANRTNLGYVGGKVIYNKITANASHGMSFIAESLLPGSVPTATKSNFDFTLFNDNAFTSNGGSGVSVDLREQTTWDSQILRNSFTSNGLRGFDLKAADTESAFNVQIGGLSTNPQGALVNGNTFTNNLGSAISFELNDLSGNLANSSGRFLIYGNVITGQRFLNNVYAGEGIRVRARGDVTRQNGAASILNSVIDRNTISSNAGDGIRMDISEDSELINLLIGNTTGPNQTFDVNGALDGGGSVPNVQGDGNVISNNGGNGIRIIRLASAYVQNTRILDNRITGNAEGIYLQASNTFQTVPNAARPNLKVTTDFTLNHNDVSNNRINGIHLRTEFNAVLRADMRYNRIDSNALNGVRLTGLENNITDFENIGGRWIKNAITNNTSNGIRIENVVGSVNPLIIGQDGVDVLDQQSLGNFIARNGEDGIEIGARAGAANTVVTQDVRDELEIVNNQIIDNGRNAVGSPYLAGKGIDIEVLYQPRAFRIDRNTIQGNAGDGIEIDNVGGQIRVTAVANFIDANGGRGVDLLNRVGPINIDAEAFVRFGDKSTTLVNGAPVSNRNVVTRNGLEGFYVVNTGAPSQTQDVSAEVPLATTSAVANLFSWSNLVLDMENNEIRDNGLGVPDLNNSPASTFSGAGLVLRVGSQNSADGLFTDPDLIGNANVFSDAASAGVGTNLIQGAGTVGAGWRISGNGRVNARVVENEFSGNGGDDVLIEGYVSVIPRTTNGNWDQNVFAQNTNIYDRDPLARLNLVFVGNTGDSLDVVRGTGATDNEVYSYTNDENVFKSRNGKAAPNVSGPFGRGDRDRIVTRVGGPATTPGVPTSSQNFYYDGIGPSTLRIEDNFDVSGFTNNQLGDDFNTLAGVGISPLPVGWDQVAVGTFSFMTAWIDDVTVSEGNIATLTVTLSEDAPPGGMTILYRLSDGTALVDPNNDGNTADGDYDPNVTGSLFIAAGQRTGTINVQVNTDNVFDPGEQFYVDLFQTSYGDFVDSRGIVSIQQTPQVTITGAQVAEGDSGTKTMTFTVNLATDNPSQTISVNYATSDGTATAGSDYVAKTGTVTFLPGETSKDITVTINGDLNVESDETFNVTLSGATGGATLPAPTAVGTIVNDDTPSITISDPIVTEGSGNATFTISLSKGVNSTITVDYATADQSAVSGQDYTTKSGTLTFDPLVTTKTVTIVILNDNVTEAIETFVMNLSAATNATIVKAAGTATINDDDTPGVSIVGSVVKTEGDGPGSMVFTVTLSQASPSGPVSVMYATADQTATAGTDYQAVSGTLTFGVGETSKTITVPIIGDRMIEPLERFTVNLSNAVNGNITQATSIGAIVDDDTPTITIDNQGVLESDGFAFFTVSLSKAISGSSVSVDFTTTAGTATGNGVDFANNVGTLVFQPGQTTRTIFVQITRDSTPEPVETFFVDLSTAVNGTIAKSRGVGRIIDAAFATTLVVAPSTGSRPQVKVYGSDPNIQRFSPFDAYDPSFTGGVRVAVADVNGDGVADIVTAPNRGAAPVRVFDGKSGALISSFFPYSPGFTGGYSIGAADINGDGQAEIFVGLASQGSAIRVFNGSNGALLAAYYAYSPAFLGGVNLAVGDVTGDRVPDLIVSTASQAGAAVRVLQPLTGNIVSAFYAFSENFTGGLNVAVGDVNGDGRGEIIAGLASQGSAIRVFDMTSLSSPTVLSAFLAFPGFGGGISVGTTDLDFDGRSEVIAAPVAGSTPGVRFFDGNSGQIVASSNPFPQFNTGGWVAGETLVGIGQPLRLEGAPQVTSSATAVTQSQTDVLVQAALKRIAAAGATAAQMAQLANVQFVVADLNGTYLGIAGEGVVVIDVNAAGKGWFVDNTPDFDEEFSRDRNGAYRAVSNAAKGKVDLLTVLTHELAHQLGFDDLQSGVAPNSLMAASLPTATRRATKENLDDLFANSDLFNELLSA